MSHVSNVELLLNAKNFRVSEPVSEERIKEPPPKSKILPRGG